MHSRKSDLEPILERASNGDRDAARTLYLSFLQATFHVPDRAQRQPLSDAPTYPSELVYVLGIKDGERSVVPFFTDPSYIQAWCGTPLSARTLTGSQVLVAIPEGWWGALNPGQEVQKEFSPWELTTMRGLPETLDELVDELFAEEVSEPVRVKPFDEARYPEFLRALQVFCRTEPTILSAHSAMEVTADDDSTVHRLILSLTMTATNEERLRIKDAARSHLAPTLIGSEPLQILVGAPGEEILSGLVTGTPPLYKR